MPWSRLHYDYLRRWFELQSRHGKKEKQRGQLQLDIQFLQISSPTSEPAFNSHGPWGLFARFCGSRKGGRYKVYKEASSRSSTVVRIAGQMPVPSPPLLPVVGCCPASVGVAGWVCAQPGDSGNTSPQATFQFNLVFFACFHERPILVRMCIPFTVYFPLCLPLYYPQPAPSGLKSDFSVTFQNSFELKKFTASVFNARLSYPFHYN